VSDSGYFEQGRHAKSWYKTCWTVRICDAEVDQARPNAEKLSGGFVDDVAPPE
jgi:hypothetical protein